jgi:hypothetical protein
MGTRSVLDITEEFRPAVVAHAREMLGDGADETDLLRYFVRRGVPVNAEQVKRWMGAQNGSD